MAKILYISPEHVSGTLQLFQRGHRLRGHECRYVTFFPSSSNFPEDICLNLPFMPDAIWVRKIKSFLNRQSPQMRTVQDREGFPPVWRTNTAAEAVFFFLRDFVLSGRINRAVKKYNLNQFDIYHLDQGLDFFRNAHFIKKQKARGAKIVCFYHGTDLRNRGVIPEVDATSDLNLTSELDLLPKHPNIHYLHLPFDFTNIKVKTKENDPLIIGHTCRAPNSRHFKGTDQILRVVSELEKMYPVRMDLVEGLPHEECLRRKQNWDIAVDQIADRGGWGYGMNSLETLALGIPTCTRMNPQCEQFFAGHPFINVSPDTLKDRLIELIQNPQLRRQKAQESALWVRKIHSLDKVMDDLYIYYEKTGIILNS